MIRKYLYQHGYQGSYLQKFWIEVTKPVERYKKKQKIKKVHSVGNELLKLMNSISKELNIVIWPEFGTLLGAYRDHSFISFDFDIDLGMLSNEYSSQFHERLMQNGVTLVRTLVKYDNTSNISTISELTYQYKGLNFDLFLSELSSSTKRNVYVCPSVIDEIKKTYRIRQYTVDYADVIETVYINNIAMKYPGNVDVYLKSIYGETYMTPIKNWKAPKTNPIMKMLDENIYYALEL